MADDVPPPGVSQVLALLLRRSDRAIALMEAVIQLLEARGVFTEEELRALFERLEAEQLRGNRAQVDKATTSALPASSSRWNRSTDALRRPDELWRTVHVRDIRMITVVAVGDVVGSEDTRESQSNYTGDRRRVVA